MEYFHQAQDWLLKLASEAKFFRENTPPSLMVMEKILELLGRPDRSFEWRIIVGGTAGKGTVCYRTEDVFLRQGKKVITLTSPHLQVVTERIRLNGKLIGSELFGKAILQIRDIAAQLKLQPTYYETIVLAGILTGKDAGCEIFIGEIGLGGRLDAVNVVGGKRIAALTFIGEDHLQHFGTLKNMAREKAGIFTSDSVLNLSYEKKFRDILTEKGDVQFLTGIESKLNKKLSRKICERVLGHSDFQMQKIQIPGRWEKIGNIILDNAHSAPRMKFILPKIKKIKGRKIGILGLGKNHDPEIFKIIAPSLDEIIWTKMVGVRDFWDPKELQKKIGKGIIEPDPIKAFEKAKNDRGTVFVFGMFLSGEIRNLFYTPEKILSQQTQFPK
ncbi:hypothetical protein K9M59_03770 [Candidatus Gracilibacteria bacterium]|nr:hypothetical protein [Candidatus Gracilibacteria bacterium]MCF7819441.1 hypothetical protein [Candidatus Gracilibacteria bacterium]